MLPAVASPLALLASRPRLTEVWASERLCVKEQGEQRLGNGTRAKQTN